MKKQNNLLGVTKALAKIPSIHYGGCGISAYIMSLFVENPRIVLFYNRYDEEIFQQNERALQGKDLPCVPTHVGLIINNQFIDCCGNISSTKYAYYQECSIEFLKKLIQTDGWNKRFDRSILLSIEKKLKIDLKFCY